MLVSDFEQSYRLNRTIVGLKVVLYRYLAVLCLPFESNYSRIESFLSYSKRTIAKTSLNRTIVGLKVK